MRYRAISMLLFLQVGPLGLEVAAAQTKPMPQLTHASSLPQGKSGGNTPDSEVTYPYDIEDKSDSVGFQCRGQVVRPGEKYRIASRKTSRGYQATITAEVDGYRYTLEDVTIRQRLYDGNRVHLEPGEADHPYNFHISPDHRWLLATRGASNHLFFGTLFHRVQATDNHFVPVNPQGKRLDEAAVSAYAHARHLSAEKLGGGARYVHFKKWDQKRGILYFSVAVAPKFFVDGKAWLAAFDLKTGTIRTVKDLKY